MNRILIFIMFLMQGIAYAQSAFPAIQKPQVFDASYQSLLSQAATLNITAPTIPSQTAQNKFITDLKGYGLWSSTWDALYIFITDGANNFTTINLVSPSSTTATRGLDPSFSTNSGLKFNGVDNYIDIPFQPASGVNFTQNSCEIIIYYKNIPNSFSVNLSDGCRQSNILPTLAINPQNSSGAITGFVNNSTAATFTDPQFDLTDGLYYLGRTSSSSVFAKKGTGSRVTVNSNNSSGTTANDFYLGALNQAGSALSSTYSSRTVGLFAAGRLLTTTEEANFKTAWDSYLATLNAQPQYRTIGSIYNASNFPSLSAFTDNGSGATTSGGHISMTTGNGGFTKSLDLTQCTKLSKWTMNSTFSVSAINSTSFGFGLGIRSANTSVALSCCALFSMTTTNQGKIFIYAGNSMTNTTSTGSAVSFSANDIISMTVTLNESLLSVSAYNVTTNGSPLTTTWDFVTGSLPQNLPNTGRFAMYSLGGTLSVYSLSISSNERYRPKLLILGDSKTQYYKATRLHLGYAYDIMDYYGAQNVVVYAGGNDRSADYLLTYNDIINTINPQNVLIAGVSNDVRTSSTAYQTNIPTITSALTSAGINWVFSDGLYETSISQSSVTTWANSNISSGNRWNSNTTTLTLNADNIHPDNPGAATFANSYLTSGKAP